ncbi:hypothetical protein CR513_59596, partial [Mucuna pruriens]
MSGTSRNPSSSIEAAPAYCAQEHYDWVSREVRDKGSKLSSTIVEELSKDGGWCTIAHCHCFTMEHCSPYECEGQDDFVYMYKTVLTDLGVTLPFDSFVSRVLRILGLVSIQLHPNGWEFAKPSLSSPQPPSFSTSIPRTSLRRWVGCPLPITVTRKGGLFTPYTDSYKGFKNQFLRIVSVGGASFSTDTEPFPLYWKFLVRFPSFTESDLSSSKRTDLRYLERLPKNMDCKKIVPLVFERQSTNLFIERACHAAFCGEADFIYMYEPILRHLGVTLTFYHFEAEVLWTLGLAPSQLHPSGWAIIQAFRLVCRFFCIIPTTSLLLHFYYTQVAAPASWVSLTPRPGRDLFSEYKMPSSSFKPWFSRLQWSTSIYSLPRFDKVPVLSSEDQTWVPFLKALPRGMDCNALVKIAPSLDIVARFKDYLRD